MIAKHATQLLDNALSTNIQMCFHLFLFIHLVKMLLNDDS
jgi:hypothetical protein